MNTTHTRIADFPPADILITQPRLRRIRSAAFSLVEVSLAIGVMGFAFVAIIGLMPVSLGSFRTTKTVSVVSDISERIFSELQDTPFNKLTAGTTGVQQYCNLVAPDGTTTRYFDDQGTETASNNPSATYNVNVYVYNGPPYTVLSVTPPSPNANPALAAVTIQIAYNPGRQTLTVVNGLWNGKTSAGPTVQIFSYNTFVAKNS